VVDFLMTNDSSSPKESLLCPQIEAVSEVGTSYISEGEGFDYPKHYCGVFGIFNHPNAAELTYFGLYALQHRGQESAGIVSCFGSVFHEEKGMGLVPQIFTPDSLARLKGRMAVGHTRYSTTGSSHIRNASR